MIRENDIDGNCVQEITNLVRKRQPESLEVLRLSHCKMNWKITKQLLENLKTKSYLRKLELVKANLNEFSIADLGEVVQNARALTHLDLSWNYLPPVHMLTIVEILSGNRRLQYINLAWNALIAQDADEKDQMYVLELLGKMIKHNLKFLHFDLTSTGLTHRIVEELGKQLRRSRSLLSIHLSGNPGVNDQSSRRLRDRVHARPNEDISRYSRISSRV